MRPQLDRVTELEEENARLTARLRARTAELKTVVEALDRVRAVVKELTELDPV
jgi:hypothetical protein